MPAITGKQLPINEEVGVTARLGWVRAICNGRPSKRLHVMHRLANIPHGDEYTVHAPVLANLYGAVVWRILYVDYGNGAEEPIQPFQGAFELLDDQLFEFSQNSPSALRMSENGFLRTYDDKPRLKQRYISALESLKYKPLTQQDAEVDLFGKREKTNVTKKPNAVQRAIQPRSPRYGAELGRYMKSIEPCLMKGINKTWGLRDKQGRLLPVVYKGMNAHQQGDALRRLWDTFDDPVAVGTDAKRWDQHVSKEALEWEHSLYLRVFRGSKRERRLLQRLLSWQLANKGRAHLRDGSIKYRVSGKRCSGDFNTGCGNCALMCAIMNAYQRCYGFRMGFVNNGDDGVVIVERRWLSVIQRDLHGWFEMFGFFLETEEPVYDFNEIEFCQTRPVHDGERYVMCRNPNTAIAKDQCTVNYPTSEKVWSSLIWSNGACGEALAGGLPVFNSFYRALKRAGRKGKNYNRFGHDGLSYLSRNMHRKFGAVSTRARVEFWKAFGILPDTQIALEAEWDNTEINWSTQDLPPVPRYPSISMTQA